MTPVSPPLAAVLRFVWASLTVRLGRHVVTALSVVLAVAFLVSVGGEAVATRAVALADAAERRAADQVQTLRAAALTPRQDESLIALMVRDPDAAGRWLRGQLGDTAPAIDAATAAEALALLHWTSALPSSRAWLVMRSVPRDIWVTTLDGAGRLAALRAVERELRGVPLPLNNNQLEHFATRLPDFRAALAAFAQAERQRLDHLVAAGGVEVRFAALENDTIQAGDALLPVPDLLADWTDRDQTDLRAQLRLERLRLVAQTVLAERARRDPARIDVEAVDDWAGMIRSLQTAVAQPSPVVQVMMAQARNIFPSAAQLSQAAAGDLAARHLVITALDTALDDAALAQPALWKQRELPGEAVRLLGQDPATLAPRALTHLNRLLLGVAFPGISSPLAPVPAELDKVNDDDAPGLAARVALRAALGADDAAAVEAEQTRRERRATLSAAFSARGGDPVRPDTRRIALALLALLVCAVGVVNALIMAIHERFREIATMKCLGARDGFIVRTVLWEAAIVGTAGAILGAGLGSVVVLLQAGSRYGAAFWEVTPGHELILMALVGVATGVALALVGAVIPARIAARMQPVAALRVEA